MTEEMAIPVYAKHLESTLLLSGVSQNEKLQIDGVLTTLRKESEGHERLFQKLISEIEGSSQDVY